MHLLYIAPLRAHYSSLSLAYARAHYTHTSTINTNNTNDRDRAHITHMLESSAPVRVDLVGIRMTRNTSDIDSSHVSWYTTARRITHVHTIHNVRQMTYDMASKRAIDGRRRRLALQLTLVARLTSRTTREQHPEPQRCTCSTSTRTVNRR
jgi:hypothetical protein